MLRTVKYLFIALIISVMLAGCSESTTAPEDKASVIQIVPNEVSIKVAEEHTDEHAGIKEYRINHLVTDSKGNPIPHIWLDFEIIEGDATLERETGLTSDSDHNIGETYLTIYKKTLNAGKVKATVYGYDASVITSIAF